MDHVFGVKSKDPLSSPRSQRFTPVFPKSFIALCFIIKPMIHSELTWGESSLGPFFVSGYLTAPAPRIEKAVFLLLNLLYASVKNQLSLLGHTFLRNKNH